MAKFNNYTVIKRYDRPSNDSRVFLEFLFMKDGILQDPYQVCSVHVFPDNNNGAVADYTDTDVDSPNYGEIESSAVSSAGFVFTNSVSGVRSAEISALYAEANYGASSASGIFKIRDGHFAAVLTPNASYYDWAESAASSNTVSAIGDYMDLWTIVATEGSKPRVFVNQFELFNEGVFALTEIPLVTVSHNMVNKYIPVGSTERIKIACEYSTENRRTDRELMNLLQDSGLLTDIAMSITKLNEGPDLTSRVVIKDFDDTSADVDMNSENVATYLWNTNGIVPKNSGDILGGTRGVYEIQLRYNIFGETRFSERFTLVVH